ncbi:hypothetical protein A8M32_05130 [Sinorhizobium alkalisoli]|uniref:Uncharacterized protein n=1 Tax=Sinorhizobium alkalisoli TaxID=1752398 RepID=A0A1E3VFP9_9HYPH|nr:hypothetical protein A8M32_05130 [Sinorhizobium alkalisoli]
MTVASFGFGVSSFALTPVLVTGVEQRRVCGAEASFQPKDLGWLDSCDKHGNEDGRLALPFHQPARQQ